MCTRLGTEPQWRDGVHGVCVGQIPASGSGDELRAVRARTSELTGLEHEGWVRQDDPTADSPTDRHTDSQAHTDAHARAHARALAQAHGVRLSVHATRTGAAAAV